MTKTIYLAHHGIKGMKWGVRRYQNPDGSLTDEGLLRYRNKHESSGYKFRNASSYFGGSKTSVGRFLHKKSDAHFAKARQYGEEYAKRMSSKSVEVTDKMISDMAKRDGISKSEALRMANYAMENYKKAEKSDVIKKYPHDFAGFGHPIQAGGYWNNELWKEINSKSINYYEGKAYSDGAKKAYRKLRAARNKGFTSSEYKKAKQDLLSAVLKDLKLPDTQENRDAIEDHAIWH